MKHQAARSVRVMATLAAFVSLALVSAAQTPAPPAPLRASAAKTSKAWVPARTPDGQPDIQGTWVNFDSTPFEKPGGVPVQPAAPAGVSPPSHWADHDSPVND